MIPFIITIFMIFPLIGIFFSEKSSLGTPPWALFYTVPLGTIFFILYFVYKVIT